MKLGALEHTQTCLRLIYAGHVEWWLQSEAQTPSESRSNDASRQV